MAHRYPADPRPDLGDGVLYGRLLAAAYGLDGADPRGLFGVLHGMRCHGARIGTDFGRARLLRGEIPEEEYGELRGRYLLPRAEEVGRLLAGVGPWGDVSPGRLADG